MSLDFEVRFLASHAFCIGFISPTHTVRAGGLKHSGIASFFSQTARIQEMSWCNEISWEGTSSLNMMIANRGGSP